MAQLTNPPTVEETRRQAIATAEREMGQIAKRLVGSELRRASVERVRYPADNGSVKDGAVFVAELADQVTAQKGADLIDALLDYLGRHPNPWIRDTMTVEVR